MSSAQGLTVLDILMRAGRDLVSAAGRDGGPTVMLASSVNGLRLTHIDTILGKPSCVLINATHLDLSCLLVAWLRSNYSL